MDRTLLFYLPLTDSTRVRVGVKVADVSWVSGPAQLPNVNREPAPRRDAALPPPCRHSRQRGSPAPAVRRGQRTTLPVETTRHAFAYVFAGAGKFCNASGPLSVPTEAVGWADTAPPAQAENRSLVLFDRGDEVTVQAGEEGIRFLLVSGKPLQEPVAWYGPIVMNTQEQLRQAFDELEKGTFLK